MKTKIYLLAASALTIFSCAPSRSIHNPTVLKPEPRYDVFADLLQQNADRIEVEVTAVLGANYRDSKTFDGSKHRDAVVSSLFRSGMSANSPAGKYGNTVYRINNTEQAKRILDRNWPRFDFGRNTEIGQLFYKYPNASVALMECDNQRIFFFNDANRLVAIYPDEGGGCS